MALIKIDTTDSPDTLYHISKLLSALSGREPTIGEQVMAGFADAAAVAAKREADEQALLDARDRLAAHGRAISAEGVAENEKIRRETLLANAAPVGLPNIPAYSGRLSPPFTVANPENPATYQVALDSADAGPASSEAQLAFGPGAPLLDQPFDSAGRAWDVRVHASSKALLTDGTWRQRRGVDPATLAAYNEGTLDAPVSQSSAGGGGGIPTPPVPAASVPPPPPQAGLDGGSGQSGPSSLENAPIPLPPAAGGPLIVPPPPVPAPVAPTDDVAVIALPAGLTFDAAVKRITAAISDEKSGVTVLRVVEACKALGVDNGMVGMRGHDDLLPALMKGLGL